MASLGNVTSLTNNGLRDWLIQRVSAIVIATYTLYILGFIFLSSEMQYSTWHSLFENQVMRISTAIVLMSLVSHAWIGMWTISTDYIKNTLVRLVFQVSVLLALLAMFIWGIEIVWGL